MKSVILTRSIQSKLALLMSCVCFCMTTSATDANDFEKELDLFCAKAQSCALAELKKNVPPELQEMAKGMVSGVCEGIKQNYQAVFKSEYKDLVQSATACMQSMNNLNCDQLQGDIRTPECIEFETLSEKYAD